MTLAVRPAARPTTVWNVLAAPLSPRTWAATSHVVGDLLVGTLAFTFAVTGLAVTFGMLFTIVFAVPALGVLLLGLRALGAFERARFASLLGVAIPDPYPVPAGTTWNRVRAWVFDPAPWKELLYALLLFPLACIGFTVVVVTWSGSLALALLPAYLNRLPDHVAHIGFLDVSAGPSLWVASAIGCVGLFLAPWVARGWAELDILVGTNLLGRPPTDVLEDRVETLESSRSWAVEIAEAERRRIERDLHDGAQQRLVAVAMDLGMARDRFDDDPERTRELIEHAHDEAKRAIVELRDLARGIHPVSLGDRGLSGAIAALAGRCPIPVDVFVDLVSTPPPAIEGIAYFVVSECLANAVKHSSASRVFVRVADHDGVLYVKVTDDGVGGADLALGTGLIGLSERVASVDGTFDVTSPLGGPTKVSVELPCGS